MGDQTELTRHLLGVAVHADSALAKKVLMAADHDFTKGLGNMMAMAQTGGAIPDDYIPHFKVLTHPDATHEDRVDMLVGSGIGDWFKKIGNGILNNTDKIGDAIKLGAKIAPHLMSAFKPL